MRLTGFSDHTLRKANLTGLASLVVRDGYNLVPLPDANGLFHVKSKEMKRWQDRYQTTIIYDLAGRFPVDGHREPHPVQHPQLQRQREVSHALGHCPIALPQRTHGEGQGEAAPQAGPHRRPVRHDQG